MNSPANNQSTNVKPNKVRANFTRVVCPIRGLSPFFLLAQLKRRLEDVLTWLDLKY